MVIKPPEDLNKLTRWLGMLSNDEVNQAIMMARDGDPGLTRVLKELEDEKVIRADDPANSARAKNLHQLLEEIGRSNHDHTTFNPS